MHIYINAITFKYLYIIYTFSYIYAYIGRQIDLKIEPPDINNETVEATILHMVKKHNINHKEFLSINQRNYSKLNNNFNTEDEDVNYLYQFIEFNDDNEGKGKNEIQFVPELLSAIIEAVFNYMTGEEEKMKKKRKNEIVETFSAKQIQNCYRRCSEGFTLRTGIRTPIDHAIEAERVTNMGGNPMMTRLMGYMQFNVSHEDEGQSQTGLYIRSSTNYSDLSAELRAFFCRRCFTYNCGIHGYIFIFIYIYKYMYTYICMYDVRIYV
jgi:hypothetical protein